MTVVVIQGTGPLWYHICVFCEGKCCDECGQRGGWYLTEPCACHSHSDPPDSWLGQPENPVVSPRPAHPPTDASETSS